MKKAIICSLILIHLLSLSGCSALYSEAPDADKMESVFSGNKEDFQRIADYLLETYPVTADLDAVYIEGSTITVFRTQTDTNQLDRKDYAVADAPIADAYNNLTKAGCQSIAMDPPIDGKGHENVIYFRMWTRTIDEADSGIAYAIDRTYPPQIEFQTALEPLSEEGWYYCIAEYNEWRNTKPTFIEVQEDAAEPDDLVVSEKYYNVYAYDEENPDQKAQDTVTIYEYEFDSEGHPTKTTEKIDGKVQNVREMAYDAAGNVIAQTVYDPDGNKTYLYEFAYDENHRKTKFVTHNVGSGTDSEITYEYDENGYLIAESYQSGDYAYTIRYENDEDGKKLASVQYDESSSIVYKTECEYDSDGRLIRESQSYDYGGGMSGSSTVEYEYDDRGNAVKEVCYDADGTILYSYDREYKTVKELISK